MDALVAARVENVDGSWIKPPRREEAGQFIQLRFVKDASAEGEGVVGLRIDFHIEYSDAFIERFGEVIEDVLHGAILPSVLICALVWEIEQ